MRKRRKSLSLKICYAYHKFSACIDSFCAAFFYSNHSIILSYLDDNDMNKRKQRGRGRSLKDRYPRFRPSEEIVALWMLLEPKNFRATIENYVGKPPKGFRIKEARKLADLGKEQYFSLKNIKVNLS